MFSVMLMGELAGMVLQDMEWALLLAISILGVLREDRASHRPVVLITSQSVRHAMSLKFSVITPIR